MSTATHPFARSYTADPAHSSFQAELRHMGVGTFRTSFADVDARLVASADGLQLTGRAAVESISITRPAEFRAHVVRGEDFFDADRHPYLEFASTRLELGGDGRLDLDGLLTMRGVERPITATGTYRAPVEDLYGGRRAAIDLTAEIDRRDWGMGFQARLPGGGDVLSWMVALSVRLELLADAD